MLPARLKERGVQEGPWGAASAAFSPDFIRVIDPSGASLDQGQIAALATFSTLVGGGLAGLAGLNAQSAATTAQNEALNNSGAGDHPAQAAKNGGVLSTLADAFIDARQFKQQMDNWLTGQASQFVGVMNRNSGQTPPSDPNPLVDANNGNPPHTGLAPATPTVPVCDPPVCTMLLGSPGTPGNAILSSGNSGSGSGGTNGQGSANNSDQGLDWSIVSKSGETLADHVIDQHGDLNLNKPNQVLFYGDPVSTVNDAWNTVHQNGIQPVTNGSTDIYVVPRPNSGYAGGYTGQRQNLNSVTIITVHGTNQVITAFPGNGLPLPQAP